MEFLGYLSLGFMGMTLGLIGAGGSILTIPILLYLLNTPILLAASYSLVLVGVTALIATIRYRNNIILKRSVLFIIPSIVGVFGARHFMMPNLPSTLGGISIDKAMIILLLICMAIAGYFMIRTSPISTTNQYAKNQSIKVIVISLSLGIIMGLLGAGGGFLIIPTLVLLMGLTMQEAVPTSLFIITLNSLIGFAADKHDLVASDWINLAEYLACTLLGMIIGLYSTKFVKGERLKRAFGYFVWIVGGVILIKAFIL